MPVSGNRSGRFECSVKERKTVRRPPVERPHVGGQQIEIPHQQVGGDASTCFPTHRVAALSRAGRQEDGPTGRSAEGRKDTEEEASIVEDFAS